MVIVRTGNNDLKFRVQGKLVDFDSAVSVRLDHNVQKKINNGSLVITKRADSRPKVEKPIDKKEK